MNDPSVWSHRDMRLVLPARALSFFGDSIAFVVLSLRISESEQPALMTLLFIAFALPLFALSGVAGRLVDEHDSRRLLVGAGALQVVASLGLVMAPNVPAMLGCVLLLQTGQAVTGPTWAALVPRIVGDALVGRAVGLQQTLSAMAGLAGAAVGGVLYDLLGYSVTLLLDTATFASLVVVAETVRTRRGRRYDVVTGHEANSADRDADAAISGRQFILKDSLLRLLVPALCLFILAAEATNVVEVFLITDDLGASAAMYGVAMAAYMLGQISGPLLAGRVLGDASRIGWTAASAAVIRSRNGRQRCEPVDLARRRRVGGGRRGGRCTQRADRGDAGHPSTRAHAGTRPGSRLGDLAGLLGRGDGAGRGLRAVPRRQDDVRALWRRVRRGQRAGATCPACCRRGAPRRRHGSRDRAVPVSPAQPHRCWSRCRGDVTAVSPGTATMWP
ncbi:MAG: MFS transporter [Propionibacteriales bacterium]|nr:MFS transporter [Propionibacteriales bacterium]